MRYDKAESHLLNHTPLMPLCECANCDVCSAQVTMAGGTSVYVPLRLKPHPTTPGAQIWSLDMDELRRAFTPKTKLLLINTPQNPTGKMFTMGELEGIAAILRDFPRAIVVSDEVYEHMTYGGKEHVRLATLPDMWERTITVSSAGKTFSITGWKIGYVRFTTTRFDAVSHGFNPHANCLPHSIA